MCRPAGRGRLLPFDVDMGYVRPGQLCLREKKTGQDICMILYQKNWIVFVIRDTLDFLTLCQHLLQGRGLGG